MNGSSTTNLEDRMILSASFSTENANPTDTAINKLRPSLQNNIRPQPNAVAVLKMTIGFKTGAAKRKVTPADSGSPLRKSRRVSGTVPHSHMGKISPSNAPLNAAGKARRGVMRVSQSSETKTSISPEAVVQLGSCCAPGYVTIALRGDFFFAGERRVAASLSFGVTYF